jgi:hypothetical protein
MDPMLNDNRGFMYVLGIRIDNPAIFEKVKNLNGEELNQILDLLAETFIPEYNQKIKELTGKETITAQAEKEGKNTLQEMSWSDVEEAIKDSLQGFNHGIVSKVGTKINFWGVEEITSPDRPVNFMKEVLCFVNNKPHANLEKVKEWALKLAQEFSDAENKETEKATNTSGGKENREDKKSYKSTLTHKKGRGYFRVDGKGETLVYFESPKTLIINEYEFTTNTNTNKVVGDGNGKTGYILFHDGSRFDGKTGKLELAHNDGSTEITIRKLSNEELDELKQKQQEFQNKMGDRVEKTSDVKEGFSRINLKRGDTWYTIEHNISGIEITAPKDSFVIEFKDIAEVNLQTGKVKKLKGWKKEFEINVSGAGNKDQTSSAQTMPVPEVEKKSTPPTQTEITKEWYTKKLNDFLENTREFSVKDLMILVSLKKPEAEKVIRN